MNATPAAKCHETKKVDRPGTAVSFILGLTDGNIAVKTAKRLVTFHYLDQKKDAFVTSRTYGFSKPKNTPCLS